MLLHLLPMEKIRFILQEIIISEGKVGKSDEGVVKLKVYYGDIDKDRKVGELNSFAF